LHLSVGKVAFIHENIGKNSKIVKKYIAIGTVFDYISEGGTMKKGLFGAINQGVFFRDNYGVFMKADPNEKGNCVLVCPNHYMNNYLKGTFFNYAPDIEVEVEDNPFTNSIPLHKVDYSPRM
jgi:hypothetical protein